MDGTLDELSRIRTYARGLQGLLATAEQAAPATSSGSDRTGAVTVTLGADGLPKSFRVRSGWSRRVAPDAIGEAVLAAFQAALGERLTAWTRALEEQGWRKDFDRLRRDAGRGKPTTPGAGRTPPALAGPRVEAGPRSVDAIAEDVIKAFDDVHDRVESGTRTGTGHGSDPSGHLSLTISASGLVSCNADAGWASTQSATSLRNALGAALRAARTDLARQPREASMADGLDSLLGEAFALLRDPRRVLDS